MRIVIGVRMIRPIVRPSQKLAEGKAGSACSHKEGFTKNVPSRDVAGAVEGSGFSPGLENDVENGGTGAHSGPPLRLSSRKVTIQPPAERQGVRGIDAYCFLQRTHRDFGADAVISSSKLFAVNVGCERKWLTKAE